jgi:hypothetical protein
MACTNSTGTHEMKPLAVEKPQNEWEFKTCSLPAIYKNKERTSVIRESVYD